MAADGPTREKTREPLIASLDKINLRRDAHGRLNRSSANLTVSLSGVRISDGEQCALHFDRQIQLNTLAKVANIHIAAGLVRRDRAKAAGLRTGDTHGSAKWLQRHASPFSVRRRHAKRVVIAPDVQRETGKIRSQQPEVRKNSHPTPTGGLKAEQRDLQRIARLRTVDIHRSCDRIDQIGIERREIPDPRLGGELATQRVEVLEIYAIARRYRDGREAGIVPAQVLLVPVDRMRSIINVGTSR